MAGEVEKAEALKASIEAGIEKAREAQRKLIELKKKVAKVRAKSELTRKRAKQLRQTNRQLKASKPSAAMIKGGIAAIVASQIGMVRAILVVQVQKKVFEILQKFTTGCPDSRELEKVIRTRNALLKQITSFKTRIQKLSSIAKKILATVAAIKLIIKIITSIPLPTAIIPPMTGGIGIPISVLTKYSNALIKLNKLLDKLLEEAAAITIVVSSIEPPLQLLEDKLKSIDISIQECSLQDVKQEVDTTNTAFTGDITGTSTSLSQTEAAIDASIDTFFDENIDEYLGAEGGQSVDDIISELVPQIVDQISNEIPQTGVGAVQLETSIVAAGTGIGGRVIGGTGTVSGIGGTGIGDTGTVSGTGGVPSTPLKEETYYNGYSISIVRDPESPKLAPKNYAIAKDSKGIIVLRGPSSFSSSTSILVEELKFRIDQLL